VAVLQKFAEAQKKRKWRDIKNVTLTHTQHTIFKKNEAANYN